MQAIVGTSQHEITFELIKEVEKILEDSLTNDERAAINALLDSMIENIGGTLVRDDHLLIVKSKE